MKTHIPYVKPSSTDIELGYVRDAVENGWGNKCYDYIHRFENAFKKYLGVKYAMTTSSCTGSIHIGLAALGIGPGDEVILADTNWIATAAPIVYLGASPVFVDILRDTWCLDPDLVKAAITPRTKAIIAVHLYGNLCEMSTLLEIGEQYGVPIVEDAAEAIGSVYHGKRAGSIGAFGSFSFHGTKTITTGEGGMFVTNDKNLFDKAYILNNHGRKPTQVKQFWPDSIGFKYRLSNMQAAFGCGQMDRIDELTKRKREILNFYKKALNDEPDITLNPELTGTINGAWMPNVVFKKNMGVSRAMLQEAFKAENIDARVFFYPLSELPMFDRPNSNSIATSISQRAINLPSFHEITHEEQSRVVKVLKSLIPAR